MLSAVASVTALPGQQRCQFHLQQNAQAYVPKQEMKGQAAADLRAIFTAMGRQAAQMLFKTLLYLTALPLERVM